MAAGRPHENLYEKYHIGEKLEQIEIWCRNGSIDKDIAKKLHIGLTTFYKIKKEFPELNEVLKKNKDYADNLVENALFKTALGFEYEETTQELRVGKDGVATPVLIKKTKKFMSPNITAQIYWTKNRRPETWRDKQIVEHEGNTFMEAIINAGKKTTDGNEG